MDHRTWFVQCMYSGYFKRVVAVGAATVSEACEKAIEIADKSDCAWSIVDDLAPTFVNAVTDRGEETLWKSQMAVPMPYVESVVKYAKRAADLERLLRSCRDLLSEEWALHNEEMTEVLDAIDKALAEIDAVEAV